jgi:hypothetical protein
LALTRGSGDFAPLWLQEGIAKREEDRWRKQRPFDGKPDPDQVARGALLSGNSVGIDRIGPSIAMLPTPEAASISYAEVESFMDFWIRENGRAAFALLLHDMRGLGIRDTDPVLLSVTGYPLSYWIARWQAHLQKLPEVIPEAPGEAQEGNVVQSVRLGDLLTGRGNLAHASKYFERAVESAGDKPAVRFRGAANQLARGQSPAEASEMLGEIEQVGSLHGGWLGLRGRLLEEKSPAPDPTRAQHFYELAIAVDPLGVEAACEGHGGRTTASSQPAPSPADATRRRLCEAARKIVRH